MKYYIALIFSALFLLSACKEKLTGVIDNWFEDGFPQKILYYKIQRRDSILVKSTEYHPNHAIFIEGGYKNGKREGEWKSWYDNGNLWSVGTFKEGVQVGKTMTYYENGNLRYSGSYDKNEKRIGEWKFYDEDNNLIETIKY
jgi:antitoxin component YwqK of YwqJK toxin-antitoxin module